MAILIHKKDLPSDDIFADETEVSIDTETLGLNIQRDRLCVIQIADSKKNVHLVQFVDSEYKSPNLVAVLTNPKLIKIMHYARYDTTSIYKYLKTPCSPIFCTKIASKVAYSNRDKHGLRDMCKIVLGVDLQKACCGSFWGRHDLTKDQIKYAINDVIYLHELKKELSKILLQENRMHIVELCCEMIPAIAKIESQNWNIEQLLGHM